MKVKSITYLTYTNVAKTSTYASIDVPGLGEIKIDDCLSQETVDRMIKETEIALRQKMGQGEVCDETKE